jgi:hypothetical protein
MATLASNGERFDGLGAKVKSQRAYAHRAKVLRLARDLARSGQHENHRTIVAELVSVTGFADAQRCFADRVIIAQLDKLCRMAQGATGFRLHQAFTPAWRQDA